MRLRDFRDLIANMPVEAQAFTAKRANWESHIARQGRAGSALAAIFGQSEKVTISRRDLRNYAARPDLEQFAMATILWGYPSGMRGNNVLRIAESFADLTAHLENTLREHSVDDWRTHYRPVGALSGIALSTYTKFLAFLSIEIHSLPALILDDRIIRIIGDRLFEELEVLGNKRRNNSHDWYPEYLSCISQLASSFDVSSESIEFFLFEFGLNLKQPDTKVATQ